MKFRLVESTEIDSVGNILFEDIEDMMKYYPSISRTDFMKYVALDPTYREGSNFAGKYAKWILNLAKSGKLTNIGHVKDLLSRFDANKNHLKNKDIMSYKSMEDVEAALNSDASYQDLSHRQEVRQRQNNRKNANLSSEAEKVYEDKDWEVWVPYTYAASCKLGSGTNWCTASTETDEYYNCYRGESGGEYYININKRNPSEKYQFHFESDQFMNKNDEDCRDEFFTASNTQGLYDFYNSKYNLHEFGIYSPTEITKIQKDGFVYNGEDDAPEFATKVVVADNVTELGENCFSNYTTLQNIDLKNVTELGENCFAGCTSLQSIDLKKVTKLGEACFWGCTSLQSVDLKNVTELGETCFGSCTSLQNIDLKNVAELGWGCFASCESIQSIDLKNVTKLGENCFEGCISLQRIDLKNVAELGENCFESCTNLKEIICHTQEQYDQCKLFGYADIAVLKGGLK